MDAPEGVRHVGRGCPGHLRLPVLHPDGLPATRTVGIGADTYSRSLLGSSLTDGSRGDPPNPSSDVVAFGSWLAVRCLGDLDVEIDAKVGRDITGEDLVPQFPV